MYQADLTNIPSLSLALMLCGDQGGKSLNLHISAIA